MAAILNFSEILNKLPVHLHIVGNVIVRLRFRVFAPTTNYEVELWEIFWHFGSMFKKSLAPPHVDENVI